MIAKLILSLLLLQGAGGLGGFGGKAGAGRGAGGGCTAPTMTNRWPMYGAGNTCGAGAPCTNGLLLSNVVDVVAANNLVNSGSTAPIYTTGQVHGLAAGVFSGTSGSISLNTPIAAATVSMTYYAVVNVTAAGGNRAIIGCTGSSDCIEWRMSGSNQQLLNQGTAVIVTGATSLTTGYHLLEMEYNTSTGVASLYVCSGGTCTLDATATSAQSILNAVDTVGAAIGVNDFYDAGIAEVGFINSVSSTTRTQIGTWGSCQFAL